MVAIKRLRVVWMMFDSFYMSNCNGIFISTQFCFSMKIINSSRLLLSFCLAAVSSCAINCSSRSLAFIIPHQRTSSNIRLFGRRGGGEGGKKDKKKTYTKSNLPEKTCVVCGRPFQWRKKWERCWDEVTTCSKACNAQRRAGLKE